MTIAQRFDGLGGIEPLGAGVDAVENGVAAGDAVPAGDVLQPFAGNGVARIHDAHEVLEQGVRADVLLGHAHDCAGRVASAAHDAVFGVVQIGTLPAASCGTLFPGRCPAAPARV